MKNITLFVVLLLVSNLYSQIPQDGLFAAYELNGVDGTDLTGQNNLTVELPNFLAPTDDRFNSQNSALNFFGGDLFSTSNNFNFTDSNALTIALWIKQPNAVDNWEALVNNWNGFGNGGYYLGINPENNRIRWNVNSGITPVDSDPLTLNTWVHIAATYDGSISKLYIDGALASEIDNGNYQLEQGNLFFAVGVQVNQPDNPYDGDMDELLLYDRALSNSEIQQIINSTLSIEKILDLETTIVIYPNPANRNVNYTLTNLNVEVNSYKIVNAQGQLLGIGNIQSNNGSIEINKLPKGIYFIHFTNNKSGYNIVKKLVVS